MALKFWTTKNNHKIRIQDLDNGHLLNIIKMMEGKALVEKFKARYELANRPTPVNKVAQKILDKEMKRVEKISAKDYYPIYNDLLKEKKKRKLA